MGAFDLDHAPPASLALVAPSVRRARAADLPAVARLINRAYSVESSFVDGDRIAVATLVELAQAGHFLVLDGAGGEVVAAILVALGGGHGRIGLLAVAPELQGLGLGRRLVALAEALGAALGCHQMNLDVVNLRTELGPWYRSQGYRAIGTAPYDERPAKQPCHLVRMIKPLAGGAGPCAPVSAPTGPAAVTVHAN